ncbi:MAG: ParB/RepB/Spo0J family partition protein [Pseudomonadota bacterium]
MSKKRLGRGLDALLSDRNRDPQSDEDTSPTPDALASSATVADSQQIAIADIVPSPYQPRRHFDEQALDELAASLKTQGLLQPIVVRERVSGGYELVAGERRMRAAQRAGWTHIDAVQRSITDEEASAFALIENIQREDLNALEEAQGLARLREEFGLTQQQIADAVGKSRVAVANLLRLLNLGIVARQLLEHGDLEMGHARALLGLEGITQDQAARQIADDELSVRQTEALVKKLLQPPSNKPSAEPDADIIRLQHVLSDKFGAPVTFKHSDKGAGALTIRYSNLSELDRVLKHLGIDHEY